MFDHFQNTLIHGTKIPVSYAILLFTASDLSSITSHIHNWVLFLLWLCLFILSGFIYPVSSSSISGTYQPGEFIFQCLSFCLFIQFMGFSRQEYWSGLPFPSPVDHLLSELSTMTHPSWVALQSMAHFQSIQYWFPLRLTGVWSPYFPRDSQESYPAPQFKSINSLALSFLYGPTLTSIHDYWKNHSFD